MRKEIIIRMQLDADKGGNKALKVAASVSGVESVTVTGSGKDLLLVIGDGVDEGKLAKKLKKEVGDAEIVEIRTLTSSTTSTTNAPPSTSSYYYHRTPSPGYYQHYAASPAAVAGGQGGYGYQHYAGGSNSGLYAREVARSHPANYSPMIARHDLRAVVGRETPRAAGGEGRREHAGGGGGPNCCSIL